LTTKKDEEFLRLALAEAKRGAEEGEVPVGAIIVIEDEVVASAHNKPISLNDPTAHAEILASAGSSTVQMTQSSVEFLLSSIYQR